MIKELKRQIPKLGDHGMKFLHDNTRPHIHSSTVILI